MNLRDCAYLNDLGREKIIWGELSDNAKFVLSKYYLLNTCYFMVGEKLPYILGLLNSKLISWYFGFIATKSGMGTVRWYKGTVEQVPVVRALHEQEHCVEGLVRQVMAAKKKDPDADTSALESQIDELVYDLYGLTEEERKIVEDGTRQRKGKDGSGECGATGGGRGATALPAKASSAVKKAKEAKKPVIEEEF